MEMKQVVVDSGVVDAGINDAPRFSGGRTFEHRRLHRVGDRIWLTPDDSARLVKSGSVKAVS